MLITIIPSYSYWQYNDSPDIAAFFAGFNQLSQQYLDAFNALNLPIYTGPLITDLLLDWVAIGLYGIKRPSLPSGAEQIIGPLNTQAANDLLPNDFEILGPMTYYAATDDIFKRVLTWNLYKGDGTVFNIRWLKRRIQRFLLGVNGTDPGINETYQISITFGAANLVQIEVVTGGRVITGGALPNLFAANEFAPNETTTVFTPLTPAPLAPILKSAIASGALNLPFQYQFVVA